MKKQWVGFMIVIVLVGFVLYQDYSHHMRTKEASINSSNTSPATNTDKNILIIGSKAPVFKLPSIDDQTYTVAPNDGKPYVINFFASWCDPCQQEAPDLQKIFTKYKNQIHLYAVNITVSDNLENVKKFVKKYGISFPVLLDNQQFGPSKKYEVMSIPTSFYVDKNGVIVDKAIGVFPSKILEEKFQKLISTKE